MASARGARRIFTLPPGADFLSLFVRRLFEGRILPGFPAADDVLSLSRATIFVPTRRAAQALTRAFVAASGNGMALLPTITPLGRLESLDPDLSAGDSSLEATDFDAPAVISDLERQLTLATFVRAWARGLEGAVQDADGNAEARAGHLVGSTLGDAWALARELATLIDEFAMEGVAWEALNTLRPDDVDQYWDITRRFLRIAGEQWPAYLKNQRLIENFEWQSLVVDRIARRCADPSADPMIVVGSTGANPTTARLIAAIAAAPNGAVILPGLDLGLDDASWALLTRDSDDRPEPPATHPQTAMARLLRDIGIDRPDVSDLQDSTGVASRSAVVSEALRPPETTDLWRNRENETADRAIRDGLDGVALAAAADEREEALCVAIKLRECIERGQRAALITPDRDIARRVRVQMQRWGIAIADSGGESLRRSLHGSFARLVLDAVAPEATNIDLAALVSHPLVAMESEGADRTARHIELAVLRICALDLRNWRECLANTRLRADERDAHANIRALTEEDWSDIERRLSDLAEAFAPFQAMPRRASLAEWATAHRSTLQTLASTDSDRDGRQELENALAGLIEHGEIVRDIDFVDYAQLFDGIASEIVIRTADTRPEPVAIFGLLEARLLHFDSVVLAGLEEGSWPPSSHAGAFLGRNMRSQLGLSPPERRIGQTAHDFAQAMGAPDVLLVLAQKRGGAPTVPSRFVQRLGAYAGEHWTSCESRGRQYLDYARAIDRRDARRVSPPEPRPALDLRPSSLSVTRIETLRRDPYSIYAERILRLRPIEPLVTAPGAREYGIALHAAISTFAQQFAHGGTRDDLLACGRRAFAGFAAAVGFEEFIWPNVTRVLNAYFHWESDRSGAIVDLKLEQKGALRLKLTDGSDFDLTAVADRIERRADGSISIFDFKTGRIPTINEIQAGFAPQLVLEAVMVAEGGFGSTQRGDIDAYYAKLGGSEGLRLHKVGGKDAAFPDLMRDQRDGLIDLLSEFRSVETAYVSRPYPRFVLQYGVYDHLARVREWSVGADAEAAA